MWHYPIEIVLSIITIFAYVVPMYALFRIPFVENFKQIAVISIVVGLLNFYLKTVLGSPYYLVAQIGTTTFLILVMRRYPILYAFLVCMTGVLCGALIEGIVTYGVIYFNLTTIREMTDNLLHNAIMRLVVAGLGLLAACLLYKYKIGFVFVDRKFSGKGSLETYNFIWVALLCLGIIVLQLGVITFNAFTIHGLILTLITFLFVLTIMHAYQQNKRIAKDRYEKRFGG